jgi:hypothetical protein
VRVGLRLLGAAIGLFVLATGLTAQTLPVPVLPSENAPEPEPTLPSNLRPEGPPPLAEAVAAAAPAAPRPWDLALGVGGGWDSNIDFLVPNGPSGAAVFPRGGLARLFSGSHGLLRATATGRWTGYPDQKLSRYYGDFGLEGDYHSSLSTSWRANASYGIGYTDSSRILVEQGVSLPVVKTRSIMGGLGLSRKMGPRTSLQIDGRFYRTEFDSPGLINGQSVRGTVGLDHQLSSRSTAAMVYALEYTRSDRAALYYTTHFGSLRWTRVLSPRSALLLEGGASYTPDAARAGLLQKGSFFGGATFTREVKGSSLTLFVRREVAPAFGIGVSRLELRGGVSATIPMGRAWDFRMVASHVQPQTARLVPGEYGLSDDAFVALDRRLGRGLQLSGETRYRRRGALGTIPMIESFQAGLFLTLFTPSGRALASAPGLW